MEVQGKVTMASTATSFCKAQQGFEYRTFETGLVKKGVWSSAAFLSCGTKAWSFELECLLCLVKTERHAL